MWKIKHRKDPFAIMRGIYQYFSDLARRVFPKIPKTETSVNGDGGSNTEEFMLIEGLASLFNL